jgi:hypothetical protein
MNEPCSTCAFRPGSVTREEEPQNRLRGELCALGGTVFYCHHGRDGAVRDLGSSDYRTQARRALVQAGETVICQGWRSAVRELAAEGYFKESPKAKRAFAQLGLGALQVFISEEEGPKKRRAAETLREALLSLYESRGYTQVVVEGSAAGV